MKDAPTPHASKDTIASYSADSQTNNQHLFEDAYSYATQEAVRWMRSGAVLSTGLVKGSVNELSKDPLDTAWKLTQTATMSTMIGFALASEAPLLVTGAAVTGLCFSGKWLYETINPNDPKNIIRNRTLSDAAHGAYSSRVESNGKVDNSVKQKDVFKTNVDKAASALGPIGSDLTIGLTGGAIGLTGGAMAYQGKFPFRIPVNPTIADNFPNYYMPPRFTIGEFCESKRQYVFQPTPLEKQIVRQLNKEAREEFPDFKIKSVGRHAHNMEEGPGLSIDYSVDEQFGLDFNCPRRSKLYEIESRVASEHEGSWLSLGSSCDSDPLLLDMGFLSKEKF